MSTPIARQMQQLYERFGKLPGINIELHKNLLAVKVENRHSSATVFLQGAQISHFKRHGYHPILWCSPLCDYSQGLSLRGGIPVCWPWFGDLSRNPQCIKQHIRQTQAIPAHGFARTLQWQLSDIDILSDDITRLRLNLSLRDNDNEYWPFACRLQLQASIGKELNVQLQIDNDSTETITFSDALHSYFAISDIDQIAINGLQQLRYIDCMDQWREHTQHGALTIDREVDRIYHGTVNDITIIDQAWNRAININSKGSNSAVIWNPWIEKSKRLSQFDHQAYKEMLCIETANADKDHVRLGPGARHQLDVCISEHLLS